MIQYYLIKDNYNEIYNKLIEANIKDKDARKKSC